ncbi:Nucleolar protein 9 [Smittium culicis]|uniref:Nucleolar protein 9 n=1 Tax=Smittium culicis TaxID=133412 RepID=A0A1R1YFK9_9FUNG|nr:Nucleolar protein 9 [Smittium culicis]
MNHNNEDYYSRPNNNDNQQSSQDYQYEAPPLNNDPLFVVDESGMQVNGAHSYDDKPVGIHPASYGVVNPELQSYLRKCEENIDDRDISEQDLEIFLERMQDEIKDKELHLTRGQEIPLMIHRFASHVLQTLISLISKQIDSEVLGSSEKTTIELEDPSEDNDNSFKSSFDFEALIINFVNNFKNSFGFLVLDPFGSHIIRSILYLLSGNGALHNSSGQSNMRSKKSSEYGAKKNKPVSMDTKNAKRTFKVPDSFKENLAELLRESNGFGDPDFVMKCSYDKVGNPTLQIIIELLADLNMSEIPGAMLDQILLGLVSEGAILESSSESTDNTKFDIKKRQSIHISSLMCDAIGSRLLEKIISVSSPSLLQKLYISTFRGHLLNLSLDPCANYVVQSFLKKLNSGPQLLLVLDELLPEIDQLIKKNRSGILASLVTACATCNEGHKACFQKVLKAFSSDPKDTTKQLAINLAFNHLSTNSKSTNLAPRKGYEMAKAKITVQGTVLIQNLLTFPYQSIKELVKSITYLDTTQDLLVWSKDASGSRIIESFLKASFDELAMDRFGSHIVDSCWNVADLNVKKSIAEELSKDANTLRGSFFGKFVWQNCNIELFMAKNESWQSTLKSSEKKKDLFKDILDLKSSISNTDLKVQGESSDDDDDDEMGAQDKSLSVLGFSKKAKSSKKSKRDSNYEKTETFQGNASAETATTAQPTTATSSSLDSVLDAIKNSKTKRNKKKTSKEDKATASGSTLKEPLSKQQMSKKEKEQLSKSKRKFF